jgi:GAF domain-containing protein/HAMP domain-containing protein
MINTSISPREIPRSNLLVLWFNIAIIFLALLNGVSEYLQGPVIDTPANSFGIWGSGILVLVILISFIWPRGETSSTWMAIVGIQLLMLIAISTYSGLLLITFLFQVVIIYTIILLLLPVQQIGTGIGLMLVGSVVSILLDIYWPLPRISLDRYVLIILEAALGLVVLTFIIFIVNQFRNFSHYIKLLLVFSTLVIAPTTIIGVVNIHTLNQSLMDQANSNLLSLSERTTNILDSFISTGLTNARVEAQSPALVDYLRMVGRNELDPVKTNNALLTLTSLGHQNPIFILSYALLDINGRNVLDTNPDNIGSMEHQYNYFLRTLGSGVPYVTTILIPIIDNIPSLYFSSPVRDPQGKIIGVLRTRYNAAIIQQLVGEQKDQAGQASFALLVDENGIILANGQDPSNVFRSLVSLNASNLLVFQTTERLPKGTADDLYFAIPDLERNLASGATTFTILTDKFGEANKNGQVAAVAQMTNMTWTVISLQNQSAFLAPIRTQIKNSVLIIFVSVLVFTGFGLGISRLLSSPIESLTSAESRIKRGDLRTEAVKESGDDIGALAQPLNNMTVRIHNLAADIGSTASRIRNVDLLLRQITRLISLRFGYYHVGIFLLDPRNEFAVLLASNSEGGQKMLARGHKLKVGQTGIVGFVTGHKQPRIALDVGQDAVFFDNPDLPETRSEIALPLLVGGKILGALDVQSKQPSAFSQEDAITLSVLADQIAIALENARLFEESQQTLETARRAFGYITGKAWEKLLQGQDIVGFTGLSDETIIQTTENIGSEALKAIDTGTTIQSEDNANLYIPIKIRENTIGVIRLDRSKSRQSWPEEDIATANLIAEQLGIALESARLYEEISQKAERETLISNTANRISSSIEFDRIMQATVEEIGHIFEDSEVVLQLKQKNSD